MDLGRRKIEKRPGFISRCVEKVKAIFSKVLHKNKDERDRNQKGNSMEDLNIDTISILTYINIEYLLDEKQKMEMIEFLRKDEAIAEQEKAKLYNPEDLSKNKKESKQQETSLVEVKIEKWYEKVFAFFKNMFKKQEKEYENRCII